nr:hypothetical protein [Pseudodesulfovibrio sp.]
MSSVAPNIEYTLPNETISLQGIVFDPSPNHWELSDGSYRRHFYFDDIQSKATANFFRNIKRVTIHFVEVNSLSTAFMYHKAVESFFRDCVDADSSINQFSFSRLVNFFDKSRKSHCRSLKAYVEKFYELKLDGVEDDVYFFVKSKKFTEVGYQAVMTCDPEKGPYTVQEYQSLFKDVFELYAAGKVDDSFCLMFLLMHLLGCRPRQISWLKVCDFKQVIVDGVVSKYILSVPRDKQGHVEPRVEFRDRTVTSDLAFLIQRRIETVKNEYSSLYYDENYDLSQLPLVYSKWDKNENGPLKYHPLVTALNSRFRCHASRKVHIPSRTGKQLSISSRRARYYLGTSLALQGYGPNIIAQMLDHSNTVTCRAYVRLGQEMADIIEKGVAQYYAPLIDSFKGKVFDKPNLVGTRQTYTPVRTSDLSKETGVCVKPTGCGVYLADSLEPETYLSRIPFSCYTCLSFNAWNDIETHEEHLKILKRERDLHLRAFEERGQAIQPSLAMSFDLTIHAIERVIIKIQQGEVVELDLEDDMVDSF